MSGKWIDKLSRKPTESSGKQTDEPRLSDCEYTTIPLDGKILGDYLCYYDRLRSYVQHEDGLINTRLTWSLTIHGFLFTTYGILLGKISDILVQMHKVPPNELSTLVCTIFVILLFQLSVCTLGAKIGNVSSRAILAAHHALQHLRVIAHEGGALAYTATGTTTADESGTEVYVRLPKIVGGGIRNETKVAGARAYYLKLPEWIRNMWIFLALVSIGIAVAMVLFRSEILRDNEQAPKQSSALLQRV